MLYFTVRKRSLQSGGAGKHRNCITLRKQTLEAGVMNLLTDGRSEERKVWKSPTLVEIPISFEASSYALTDDDDPPYR